MEPNQEIMSQKREKEETIELKVPTTESLTTSICPDNCKISSSTTTNAQICSSGSGSIPPEPARTDPDLGRTPPLAAARRDDLQPNLTKKSVNRCLCCGKRVGLTGFRCRCGELFCTVHRYTDRHDCSYDYKAAGREAIARENPVVRAAKILKV